MRDSFLRRLGTVAIALCILLLSGSWSRAAQTPKTLVLGVIGVDSPTARGVQLTVERFNARGNTVTPDGTQYRLEVQVRDANNASEIGTAITNLRQANAIAIFGPDNDELAQASVNVLLSAGAPVFTSATSPAVSTTGSLFRVRASDARMMNAYAQYITTDLGKNKIAIFQGDPIVAQRVTVFSTALGQLGKTPANTVLQVAGGQIKDTARVLLGSQPDMIVAFGVPDQAATLLRELRGQGYTGTYGYPDAQDRTFIRALPTELRSGIVGVSNWVYSNPSAVSSQFVRDYVALFGEVPTAQSAAAYDAAGAVIIAAARNGIAPDAITRGLLALPKVESIQGNFNGALGNNELSADVTVFTTGSYGAPVLNARFDETGRLTGPVVAGSTTAPLATQLPAASPTPEGVTATVKNSSLNVRRGPGTNYDVIGRLRQNDVVQVIGISPAGDWVEISFAQQQGWIVTNLVTINGSLTTVPIIEPPPSPTPPPATATPTAQPFPDLVVLSTVFNPPQPKSGQPFTVSVVIRNQGVANAGQFAVAASFLPGNVYAAQTVPGLAAGAATTVNLTATVTGPGTYTVAIVVDLNKEVNQGPNKKSNEFPISYTVVP